MDDTQLEKLVGAGQALSERLALEARYVDASLVAGLVQAVRALRTRLEPPPYEAAPVLASQPAERPALAVVTEG
jgi:hypothetical protein